jgi:arylsulfatase A-like enzyme
MTAGSHAAEKKRRFVAQGLVLIAACTPMLAIGCADEAEERVHPRDPSEIATRVTDLLDKGDADAPPISVEEFDGDFRPAWVMPLSSSFSASLNLAADDCDLVVGMRAKAGGTAAGKQVIARVSKRTASGNTVILEEELVAAPKDEGPWRDRDMRIPAAGKSASERIELVFSGSRPDGGSPEGITIGWSMPHSVCRSLPTLRREAPSRPHVVLVSIDTLRADHLSLYGYRRETSPFLDRFAKQAVVFDRAFSTAPWTAPSHASIFTGLYPEQHRAGHDDPFAALPDDVETIATILHRRGYRTIGFTAGGVMAPTSGLGQGFDRYESRARGRLRSYVPSILEEVERYGDEPLFLFLHTYDVHGPYIQPQGMRAFEADAGDPRVSDEEWARIRRPGPHDYLRLERFEGLQDVVAAYDSGIRYADGEIGLLFAELSETGLLDDALVIVTSDHGEVLYDRALYIGHTFTLHDEVLRVPLIVRRVGQQEGERRDDLVDSTDILPMVLDELGLERPRGLAGRNPLGADASNKSFVRGEAAHTGARFIRDDDRKVVTSIRALDDPRIQLPGPLRDRIERGPQWYDLIADENERHNRYAIANQTEPTALLYRQLEEVLGRELAGDAKRVENGPRELSEAEKAELRSLGYGE